MSARPSLGRALVPGLLGLFLIALGAAWIVTNPPGAGPDEAGHYVKAVAAGRGDLRGRPPRLDRAERRKALSELAAGGEAAYEIERFLRQSETAAGRWAKGTSREFSIPAGLADPAFGCGSARSEVSAACLEAGGSTRTATVKDSFFGDYQPYLYVAPGLMTRATGDATTAMRLSRLAAAALSLGLIAVAALALWDGARGALALVGLVVAFTPSVLSFATALNPSGAEVAAGICLAASLIRLARDPVGGPPWIWLAVAVSGAVLACARSLGPLFVGLTVLAIAALAGRPRVEATLRARPRAALAATVAVAVAAAAGLWWEVAYQPRLPWDLGRLLDGIRPSVQALPSLAEQGVGVFSALDTRLPQAAYVVWGLMLAVLVTVAFTIAERRERLSLVGLGLGILAVTVGTSAVYRQTGFVLQARHVLPVVVVLPLWAGELVNRHRRRLSLRATRGLLVGLTVTAAGVHALAWYANSRRFAVGTDGAWAFVPDAEWVPPLGWTPWIVVAVVGALAYGLAGLVAAGSLGSTRVSRATDQRPSPLPSRSA